MRNRLEELLRNNINYAPSVSLSTSNLRTVQPPIFPIPRAPLRPQQRVPQPQIESTATEELRIPSTTAASVRVDTYSNRFLSSASQGEYNFNLVRMSERVKTDREANHN